MVDMSRWSLVAAVLLNTCSGRIDERDFQHHKIIHKDVAILGGGGSGAYAALRLREDFGASIVVIEKANRLGGHAATYHDPASNLSINIGVQVYTPYGPAEGLFDRLNIETANFLTTLDPNATTINVDIADGRPLTAYQPPSKEAVAAATKTWLQVCRKYESAMKPGYWKFFPPGQIPAELLLPFGQFARMYGIEALAPSMARTANVGVGGFEKIPTWEIMAFAFGAPLTQAIVDNSFFVPKGAPNTIIYDRIYDIIWKDVMLNSEVIAIERSSHGVRLVVENSRDGTTTLIKADKLLVSFQPTMENILTLDPDPQELSFFSTFTPTWLYVGLLKIPWIPAHASVNFLSASAQPTKYLRIRNTPQSFELIPRGPQIFGLYWTSNISAPYPEALASVLQNVENLLEAGTFTGSMEDVEVLAFKNHNSVLWRQGEEEAQGGLMQRANALQGHRGTWWTGGLWCSDYSADVWAFTDSLLPRMLGREE